MIADGPMKRAPIIPEVGQRCVVIDDLRLRFLIGVHAHEKQARQEVSITIHMLVPESGAPPSDDLADYVSYADIVEQLKVRAASTRHTKLVETLAEEVAELALTDPRVASVVVDVRKTEIIPDAKGVGVIIQRQREGVRGSGPTDAG
jgi:7,8-dihydroneopterin aldolase/epimerase/oxygenase